jgi:hypothetical protein
MPQGMRLVARTTVPAWPGGDAGATRLYAGPLAGGAARSGTEIHTQHGNSDDNSDDNSDGGRRTRHVRGW